MGLAIIRHFVKEIKQIKRTISSIISQTTPVVGKNPSHILICLKSKTIATLPTYAPRPFEIPKSLNPPFSISYTHPWTHNGSHAAVTDPVVHAFATWAFTFSSTRIQSVSEAEGAVSGLGRRFWREVVREMRGASQRLRGVAVAVEAGEDGAWRQCMAPPHWVCPTTMTR